MMWWHAIQHWLASVTGSENTPGTPPNYNFWSGFGSDIAEVTILIGLISLYKKKNCHKRWCWRIGHHDYKDPDTGLTYMLCRAHHPDHPGRHLSADIIASIHRRRHHGD
jgi:hypothetical protein